MTSPVTTPVTLTKLLTNWTGDALQSRLMTWVKGRVPSQKFVTTVYMTPSLPSNVKLSNSPVAGSVNFVMTKPVVVVSPAGSAHVGDWTLTVTVEELLPGFGSGVGAVGLAVLETRPPGRGALAVV